MASWVFFGNWFVNSIIFLLLNDLSWSSPLRPPGNHHRASHKRDGERIPTFVPQDLQSQFLSTLNLTEQSRALVPDLKEPPEYMMELYERFSKERAELPSANMVRSFKNKDSSLYSDTAGGVRIYPLLFNVSMPHHEHIRLAELRFFIQIQHGAHQGPDCLVTIYHVRECVGWSIGEQLDMRNRDKEEVLDGKDLEELVTKHVNARDNGWVSFDLTHAVTHWQKSGCADQRLEVHIINLRRKRVAKETLPGIRSNLDRSTEKKHNAALIIFSDNPGQKNDTKMNSMIGHEHNDLKNMDESGTLWEPVYHNTDHLNQQELEKQSLEELSSNFLYDLPSRIRRNVKSDACKRMPLFVDFKDIGWDTWIIQPLGYEAYSCKGECYPPLTSEVTPTRHAMVQTLLSVKSPDRVSRACCVPTKLEPISLLYHENGVITFNHKYEGMVVAECGCR
ncbi:bone morphogenetic protein 10-like [Eucyclogobius newberryi]|uniref:bone morphogenetic protein 10-like n=1 Tax=Eucyclogobius newberryi TaxID=166745 RepID=UPI003B59CD5B